ncbi:MAG TPA: hypothetical protein VF520_04655 [Thermoleophilaceae bacterium]|jgi:hypothetical protein
MARRSPRTGATRRLRPGGRTAARRRAEEAREAESTEHESTPGAEPGAAGAEPGAAGGEAGGADGKPAGGDGEPKERPGRLARLDAGWKALSGVVATIATAVGVLATLGVVGGGGGGPASPAAAIESGAAKTADARSSRVRVSETETPRTGAAAPSRFVGDGTFDYRTGRGHMRYDFSGNRGDEDLSSVDVVFNGPTVYIHDPGGLRFPGGTPWARVSLADLQRLGGGAESDLARFFDGIEDPTRAVESLAESASGMRKVGEDPVVGADWTHYRSVRDPDGAGPAPPATKEAWVDESGFVRRIETVQPGPASTVRTRTEYDDFGVEVDVEPPPSGRVSDLIG